jgi:subtilisin-like proprotein convertase family protein
MTWCVCALAIAAALTLAAPATAETFTTTQNADVSIPVVGKATPYPSTLFVQGGDGNMTDVNISLNLSHAFPDDLDIAVVSPDGDAEILMSDACGTNDLVATTITFDSEAGAPLSDSGVCITTAQPTNHGVGDTWESPGPSVSTNQLANFNGEDPNGTWELFVMDDENPDGGTVNSWSVTVTTATAEVIIPGTGTGGVAKPYPSLKTFNTPAGKVISDLNVSTPDFNHTFPDDVDLLLAGPRRGAKAMLMSDACGSEEIHDYSWTWDDEAAKPMSNSVLTDCNPFSIKPTDFEVGDKLPAPAPAGPYGTSLTAFDGLEGGAFSLFAFDDAGSDTGFMTSWSVTATVRDAAGAGFAATSVRGEEGGTALLTVNRSAPAGVAAALLGPATINVSTGGTATPGLDYTPPAGTVEFARGQVSATIAIPLANDSVGEPTERFNVVLSSPRDDARLTGTTSEEVVIGPDNEFKFGKVKRNAKKGTARLFVVLPGPGLLRLSGEQVKQVKKTVLKAGKVALPIKPKGNAVGILEDDGLTKVRAKVAYTPTDGTVLKRTKKVKLVLED